MSVSTMNESLLQRLFSQRHDGMPARYYDISLILITISLLSIGLVIVTSASMPVATRLFDNPFHFAIRHIVYMGIACTAALVTLQIPMYWWRASNGWLLLSVIAILIAILLVGRTVNGSTRWLALGPISIQAAEPAKLFLFCYLAGYLVRRYEEVTENLKGFIKPLAVFFVMALLLLKQPDFGTVIVMFTTTLGLLFLAGAKLWQFFGLVLTGLCAVIALVMSEPYRMKRVTAFLDPWADPFGSGYQLTQSLMAYGRGNIFGQGLGNSLQKLEFLPEAHTDFIAAVLAEELGFAGVILVLGLLLALVLKALRLGNKAIQNDRPFEGYFAYGIGIWFCFQTMVNIGASAGMLPTKGLTLPLVSYGGNSLIIMIMAVAILIRIDFELKVDGLQAMRGGKQPKSAAKKKASKVATKKHKKVLSEEKSDD